jgi:hypothetical protein
VCGPGAVCVAGACACPGGDVTCNGACVDLSSDGSNCGACGNSCGTGGVCVAGTCACGPTQTACGAACADLSSSAANCGACGNACAAGQVCLNGACAAGCPCDFTGSWTVDDCYQYYYGGEDEYYVYSSGYTYEFYLYSYTGYPGECESYTTSGDTFNYSLTPTQYAACVAELQAFDTQNYCGQCTAGCAAPAHYECSYNPADDEYGTYCY